MRYFFRPCVKWIDGRIVRIVGEGHAGSGTLEEDEDIVPRQQKQGFLLWFQIRTPSAHQIRKIIILAGSQTSCSQM